MMRRPLFLLAHGERGSGVVLAVAIVAATVVLATAMVGLGAVLAIRQHVIGGADAAALAGADAAIGIAPGDPCAVAAHVAAAGGIRLGECAVDGLVVTVTGVGSAAGIPIPVRSRAGPPP